MKERNVSPHTQLQTITATNLQQLITSKRQLLLGLETSLAVWLCFFIYQTCFLHANSGDRDGCYVVCGAALVFLMAGPATNVATIGAVHRVFGNRVMAVYLLTVFIGSIGFGLIFDMFWGLNTTGAVLAHRHESWFLTVSAGLLTLLLGWFGVQDVRQRFRRPSQGQQSVELQVDGMTCGGCVKRLTSQLETVAGVEAVEVTLSPGKAAVYGADLNRDLLQHAIRDAGFLSSEKN